MGQRHQLVERVIRDLQELTMEELETVLQAIPDTLHEPDTLRPEPCQMCTADGFEACECWLEDQTEFGAGIDAFEAK